MSFACHSHATCMSLVCTATCISLVCIRMLSVCHSHLLVFHPYVTLMYTYVIRMSLVCTRMLSVCHSYVLVCYPYLTRMSLVCHSYAPKCHPYVTRMYSYVIRMYPVCTCMSSVCHWYVFVCHSYITCMQSYVIRMSLVCTRISSACYSHVLVCHPYVTRVSLTKSPYTRSLSNLPFWIYCWYSLFFDSIFDFMISFIHIRSLSSMVIYLVVTKFWKALNIVSFGVTTCALRSFLSKGLSQLTESSAFMIFVESVFL